METKRCSKCKCEKALEEFGKDKYGKDGLRYNCKNCNRAYCRKYYKDNSDTEKKRCRDYRNANPEKNIQWVKANPEKVREIAHTFYSISRCKYTPHPDCDREKIRELTQKMIEMEKANPDVKLSIDHILSAKHGGFHHQDNLQIMPKDLNTSKADELDWRHPDYKSWIDLPITLIPENLHAKYHSDRAHRIIDFEPVKELLAA